MGFVFLRFHIDEMLPSGLESPVILGSVHIQLCQVIIWKKGKEQHMKYAYLRQVHRHVFPISQKYIYTHTHVRPSIPFFYLRTLNPFKPPSWAGHCVDQAHVVSDGTNCK